MMDLFLFFMSGLTIGIAITYTYFDSKLRQERLDTLLAKIKAANNEKI